MKYRDSLIREILRNKYNNKTREELEKKSTNDLEMIASIYASYRG